MTREVAAGTEGASRFTGNTGLTPCGGASLRAWLVAATCFKSLSEPAFGFEPTWSEVRNNNQKSKNDQNSFLKTFNDEVD